MDKDKISSTFSEQPIDSLKCRRENDEIRYEKIDKYPVYVEPFHVDFTGRIFLGILGNHLLNAAATEHRDDRDASPIRACGDKNVGGERDEAFH